MTNQKENHSQLIHQFQKNATECVRVVLCNYRDKDVIDIRVYFNAGVAKEDLRPSPKGICMSVDLIPELKKAIDKAYEAWQRETNK